MNPEEEHLDLDAQLMLYVADELPAADRAELESRLANDPQLRAQLEDLTQMQAMLSGSLAALDQGKPISQIAIENHQRRWKRDLAQWQVDRLNQTQETVIAKRRLPLGVLIPLGIAAMVLFGFVGWWNAQLQVNEHPQLAVVPPPEAVIEEPSATVDESDDPGNMMTFNDADRELESLRMLRFDAWAE